MKTFRNFTFILIGFSFLLFGCKKNEVTDPLPQSPSTLNDLKASDTFNWSTGQTIEIKIKGLPTVIPVKNTLKINRLNGTTLFARFHQMSQDVSFKLVVPSNEKQLNLVYGTMSNTVEITNGVVEFSFIPNVKD